MTGHDGAVRAVVTTLRLEQLAVEASTVLAGAGVPHVLLKGPTTARWLYDPPRTYRDVDLLVPGSRVWAAIAALVGAGVARAQHGGIGEEASHSVLLTSRNGAEIDLHVTLPSMPAETTDRVWTVLRDRLDTIDLDGRTVPALDAAGRCLVLALHLVASGAQHPVASHDLLLALRCAAPEEWAVAAVTADALGVRDAFDAAVAAVGPPMVARPTGQQWPGAEVALRLGGASASAIQIARVLGLPPRSRLRVVAREVLPSKHFMRRAYPGRTRLWLPMAHLRRWRAIAHSLPMAVREVRAVPRTPR